VSDLVHQANSTYNFANPLDPEKVAEAAARAPEGRVEKLLQDLAEQKDSVKDPTAWVTSALRKAAGGGGGKRSHSQGPGGGGDDQQSDQKLRKRIGWLNGDGGGFGGAIIYDEIVKASGGLPYSDVMRFLKDLEEKKAEVKDPNAWVCSALRKAGGGGQSPAGAPFSAWGGGPPQAAWAPPSGGGYSAPMRGGDDGKLRKRVEWLNNQGGFGNSLDTAKVLEAASGADVQQVMKVLKDAEEKKDSVKNPTAYVTAALRKLGGGHGGAGSGAGGGGAYPPMAWAGPASAPAWTSDAKSEDIKLRKRVGWLNGQGGFEGAVNYTKILEASGGLEFSEVFHKLKDLEEKKGEVTDPTAWVCAGLRKAAARNGSTGGPPMRQMAPQAPAPWSGGGWAVPNAQWMRGGDSFGAGPMDVETTSRIHKRVKWLNDAARFDGAINFEKVTEAAVGVDLTSTLKVLKDLEEKKDQVKDPTAWATTALRKAGGRGGGKGAPQVGGFGVRRTIAKARH